MSDTRFGVYGSDYQSLLTITQFVIPAGAGATFSAANGIATITTNAAHGLTFNPAAGVPPNFYVGFGGSTSGLTGTGILVGNFFRILSIPSTTTFTIATSITAATVTSLTVLPAFLPPFIAQVQSQWAGPLLTQSGVNYPGPQIYAAAANLFLGANAALLANTDGKFLILDATTGITPATAPAMSTLSAASTNSQVWIPPTSTILVANGTTATSTLSVIN
jgi:hypothetical protein